MSNPVTSDYARRAAKAVYLECPEAVADDIAQVITTTLDRAESAVRALDAALAERRTPGTTEVCELCGDPLEYGNGEPAARQ